MILLSVIYGIAFEREKLEFRRAHEQKKTTLDFLVRGPAKWFAAPVMENRKWIWETLSIWLIPRIIAALGHRDRWLLQTADSCIIN